MPATPRIPARIKPPLSSAGCCAPRLHRTLKAEATRPPSATRRAQQQRFDTFRDEYNTLRPHEALGLTPPALRFHPSTRAYPVRPEPLAYPTHFLERRVTSAGLIWWHHEHTYLSQAFAGYTLGLDPVSPTHYDVYFAEYLLGTPRTFHTFASALSPRR